MKEYVALHYLPWEGDTLIPGEILPTGLPEEDAERLLRIGAIQEIAAADRTLEMLVRETAEAGDGTAGAGDGAGAKETAEAGDGTAGAGEGAEELDGEENGEEPEEIEIDALDGVIAAPAETAKAPKDAKPARKTRGGKTK